MEGGKNDGSGFNEVVYGAYRIEVGSYQLVGVGNALSEPVLDPISDHG